MILFHFLLFLFLFRKEKGIKLIKQFKVAHFYNSVDQQMLPCQQAMMLDEALAFEKLILSRKKGEATANMVSWNNPKHLQEFIEKLQAAAERLTLRNRFVSIYDH